MPNETKEATNNSPEAEIQGDSRNDIDKSFADNVKDLIDDSPETTSKESPEGETTKADTSEADDTSEPNSDKYEPAPDFMELFNKEVAASKELPADVKADPAEPVPDLTVIKDLLAESPHMAPAIKEALAKKGISLDDSADNSEALAGMKSTINELKELITGERDANKREDQFDSVNDMYLEITKDVPDYGQHLTNVLNNSYLQQYELNDVTSEIIEKGHKAFTSELDNYFEHRIKAEGYTKNGSIPSTSGSNVGDLTPPDRSSKDSEEPKTMAEIDRQFSRDVKNILK